MIGPLAPRADEAAPPVPEGPSDWSAWWSRRAGGLTRRQIAKGLLAALVLLALAVGGRSVDFDAFHAWTKRLPAAAVAALVGVLPLVGFPVSALHLAAGLRFEFWVALPLVAAATLAHHTASWALARALPERFFTRLDPWRRKLEGAGHRQAAVLCCLLPGMPYTVQLYLLPVIGAPLRVLCFVSVPLHTTRASVTILLGTLSDELTPGRVAALVAYYIVVFVICGIILGRLRRALAAEPAAAGSEAVRPDSPENNSSGEGTAPMAARAGKD